MDGRNRALESSGLTLIELLVSITILSLVMVAIFATLRVGSRAWERGEKDVDRLQRTRVVSDLLFKEIKSIFPYKVTPSELDKHREYYAFRGKSDGLIFVSTVSLWGHGGLSLVEVRVKSGEGLVAREGDALLLRDFGDDVLDDEEWVLLDPRVQEIEFKYYELKEKEEEGQWVESWNAKEEGKLPHAIQAILTIEEDDETTTEREIVIPIMNQGKRLRKRT
jgi:general secretion pathway protein J